MMRSNVLFLTRTLGRAGVAVSLVSVLQALDLKQFDVTLGVQFPVKDLQKEIPQNIHIVYYGEITSRLYQKIFDFNRRLAQKKKNLFEKFLWHALNKLEELRMIFKIRYCFHTKYDVANAYHQGVGSFYVMRFIRAKKKILWYHASVVEQKWYKKLFLRANLIVTDSENARKILIKEWGDPFPDKIVSLHPLVPIDEIEQKAKVQIDFKAKENQLVILSCGRLGAEKGMDLVVRAAGLIKKERPELDFCWLIVGEGAERPALEKLIMESGVVDQVQLVGFRSNPYPYFQICDIYVQPSRMECYGITIAEALALHKPVISTRTAGGLESISNEINGLLTEIDEKSLADAVIRLMTDKQLYSKIIQNVSVEDYRVKRAESVRFINSIELPD